MQKRIYWLAALLLGMVTFAHAADDKHEEIRAALKAVIPAADPDTIDASAVEGLNEVSYGAEVYYVTGDGRYLLTGAMIDLETRANLTENKQAEGRLRLLNAVEEQDMIVFTPAADKVKHTITVFTDIDCGYCRKMHAEIEELQDLGIAVRYVFFPRAGLGSKSYKKAISVWCADDQQQAMTDAKAGNAIEEKTCEHPVDQHMELVRKFGLSGTPATVLASGQVIPGYVPAPRLRTTLDNAIN